MASNDTKNDNRQDNNGEDDKRPQISDNDDDKAKCRIDRVIVTLKVRLSDNDCKCPTAKMLTSPSTMKRYYAKRQTTPTITIMTIS